MSSNTDVFGYGYLGSEGTTGFEIWLELGHTIFARVVELSVGVEGRRVGGYVQGVWTVEVCGA